MEHLAAKNKAKTFPKSLQQIINEIERLDTFSPQIIRKIVKKANVKREELEPWAQYNHPSADSYGRKMVYDGGFFEVMVMSWVPGDMSGIHDHGYTQWGCVQMFGDAEHSTFSIDEGKMRTLSRVMFKKGHIVGVTHDLIHQMGNPHGEEHFLSLHIYGNYDREDNITADARLFELNIGKIQRIDGGVFFALPEDEIKRTEDLPHPDYITWLRNAIETARRLKTAGDTNPSNLTFDELVEDIYDAKNKKWLLSDLKANVDENHQNTSSAFWNLLNWELGEAAYFQNQVTARAENDDDYQNYAAVYDAVVGQRNLNAFMAKYLNFVQSEHSIDFKTAQILSIGCGTGLVEQFLMNELGVQKENILGIDRSKAMLKVAENRIPTQHLDILNAEELNRTFDVAFSGLNVFHHVGHENLELAIEKTSKVINSGGYFIGDFITPDHIRQSPNLIVSEDEQVISLHTPKLEEKDGRTYQCSQIINIRTQNGKMHFTNEGNHDIYLPAMMRIRLYFERYFSEVSLYDAVTHKPISVDADTCPSTRYVVVAKK